MFNNGQEIQLVADGDDTGKTLQAFLERRKTWFPQDPGGDGLQGFEVLSGDEPLPPETILAAGQKITIFRLPWVEPHVPRDWYEVYEDRHLLIVDKPAGIPVMPHGDFFENSLLHLLKKETGYEALTPMHRLDLETSGLLLFAKSKQARGWFQQQFQKREVLKTYEAMVQGQFPKHIHHMDFPLVRDARIYTKFIPGSAGKPADTQVLQVVHGARLSFVFLRPVTGRTHQIRAHLAACGHHIVGDKKYHPDPEVFFRWLETRQWQAQREVLLLPHQALHCRTIGCQLFEGRWRQWRSRRPVQSTWRKAMATVGWL